MSDPNVLQVRPGPCPVGGCPPPTEIDCIQVDKVYDSCFQAETVQFCIPGPVTAPTTITCTVDAVTATVLAQTPTGVDDFVTFTIQVCVTFTVTFDLVPVTSTQCIIKTVTLFSPAGTFVTTTATATCGGCFYVPAVDTTLPQICCNVSICLVVKIKAEVQLLVPTYGFCEPLECVSGLIPVVCPLPPPPQLTPPV